MDDADEPTTPGSSWSFTGDEEGEDLPPTTSPEIPAVPTLGPANTSPNLPPALGPSSATSASASSSKPDLSPIPHRSPSSPSIDIPAVRTKSKLDETPQYGVAISPPDPALIAAASEDAPLGPGVSSDTRMTSQGMLEKEVDGEKITVPADEIVRGVEGRRRSE